MAKIDFQRVALLFDVAEKARQHGTAYGNIRREAEEELKKINNTDADDKRPVIQTPPAGPPNSERVYPDGTVEQLVPAQPLDRPRDNLDPTLPRARSSEQVSAGVPAPTPNHPRYEPPRPPVAPAPHPDLLPRPESLR